MSIFPAFYSTTSGRQPVAAPTGVNLVDANGNLLTVISINQAAADNIVAHSGGGQALATPLPALLNRITTSGSTDSTLLPMSTPGTIIHVLNGLGNTTAVFPRSNEQINALGANNAFSAAANAVTIFYCLTAGQWFTK